MKISFTKLKVGLLAGIMLWGISANTIQAEENKSPCYLSDEQIQEYKEDGTWEERLKYAEKLNHSTTSQELLCTKYQRNSGVRTYAAGDDIPHEWKGMQVTGDAKLLLVRVEFADVKFEDYSSYSEEEFLKMVMGDGSTDNFPYENLNAYYKRSSYNKLNITSDKVYTCTLSKKREEYDGQDSGEQLLVSEVMELLDADVNFQDYDANGDGRLDGICINFVGENTGWGSTWWSHEYSFQDDSAAYDEVTPGNYIFLETSEDVSGVQTLIHEMGHMLGLPDYYSQKDEGLGTTDMMSNNCGDHNGFSKWLLGWIEEEHIQRITKESGTTEVKLATLSGSLPENDKLIAVIAPYDTSINSEYFVVQYDEPVGNQSIEDIKTPCYRVFHVNAQLDNEGTNFKYENILPYERSLIKAVSVVEGEYWEKRDYYVEGDSLTPDTEMSSDFYGGSIMGFTGIEITDFKTGDSPSFCVSFRDKGKVDGKLEYQILGDTPVNMAELTLFSNKPLIDANSDQVAYYEDKNGNRYPVILNLQDMQQVKVTYTSIANSLKPETEYTLVIPAGMFQIDVDVYSEESRIKIKTGTFPEPDKIYSYDISLFSDLFSLDDTRIGFLQFHEFTGTSWTTRLHMLDGTEQIDAVDVVLPLSEQYLEYCNVTTIKGIVCYDGTIAVEIRAGDDNYNMISCFYKINQAGEVLAGPYIIEEALSLFPSGNGIKGIVEGTQSVGSPDIENESKLEIYTIDFKTEPFSRLTNTNKFISNIFAMDENSYAVIQNIDEECQLIIYNNNDEEIFSTSLLPYVTGVVYSVAKVDDRIVIIHGAYSEGECFPVKVSVLDMEGTCLQTKEIFTYTTWKNPQEWKLEKSFWGYTLSNRTMDNPYIFYFLDDEFNVLASLQTPSELSSGTHIGSRFGIQWFDVESLSYKVMITKPIVDDPTELETEKKPNENASTKSELEQNLPQNPNEVDVNTDGKPESSASPEEREASESLVSPSTGDTTNLWLICMVLALSGCILIYSIGDYYIRKKYR